MKIGWFLSYMTALLGLLCLPGDAGGQRAAGSPQTLKLQVDVEVYGQDNTKDTRYRIPIENGTVSVGEYAHQRGIRASDGVAGFRTYLTERGVRASHLFITGTKHRTEYIDIDGDGLLDALHNHSTDKLFIVVDGGWVEVGRQKVGFSEGNSRTTQTEPRQSYTFKGSAWVRD
jgi:hypothetical protein